MSAFFRIHLAFTLLAVAGCGGNALCPVAGKVLVDGEPLTKGFVVYHPDDDRPISGEDLPRAELDLEGGYQLRSGKNLGAPPGKYRVVIVAQDLSTRVPDARSAVHPEPQPLIDRKYFVLEQTPLRAEVKKDASAEDYDFKVTRSSPKSTSQN